MTLFLDIHLVNLHIHKSHLSFLTHNIYLISHLLTTFFLPRFFLQLSYSGPPGAFIPSLKINNIKNFKLMNIVKSQTSKNFHFLLIKLTGSMYILVFSRLPSSNSQCRPLSILVISGSPISFKKRYISSNVALLFKDPILKW